MPSSSSPVRMSGRAANPSALIVPSVDESALPTRSSAESVTSTGVSV